MASSHGGKRVRRGAEGWRTLLAEFSGSKLSVVEFCRREAISEATFYRWRTMLAADRPAVAGTPAAPPAQAMPAFVDLGTLAAPQPQPGNTRLEIRLDLGAGVVLHVVRG